MMWKGSRVATDGTHHVTAKGKPMYEARFDRVLPFHTPGLAPVADASGAYHIRPDGVPAYEARFDRAFGLYQGRAAVIRGGNWFHILSDATRLYVTDWAWCGNFQEGRCPVRNADGRYLHIDLSGRPAYSERWRYAGDYRGGITVVQGKDGLHTHIDGTGELLHKCWFMDLDVFHKGFARARDERGWMHIDAQGRPPYERRFAAVEPFYNGQARVERFDGGLEVIDESGKTAVVLRSARQSGFAALSRDMVGFWRTQAIGAAVEVGAFEVLPADTATVAEHCGLDPARAGRLLRALGELGLVERNGNVWESTSRGTYLRRDHPLTLADAAIEYARHLPHLWTALPRALRSGSDWRARDIFADVANDRGRVQGHHRMLRSYARHDYDDVPEVLGLRGDEVVIDAGGGLGTLAEGLLRRHTGLRVALLDRSEVLAQVSVPDDLAGRLDLHAANLFEPWGLRADSVILTRVLHDWPDDKAVRILRHARAAVPAGGRVFIVEMVLDEHSFKGALCDLHLLVTSGGRERTASQYATLLTSAGFDSREVRELPSLLSVVVGVAR